MSRLVDAGAVAGFEPDPYNYGQAINNLKKNEVHNLTFYDCGLGERGGHVFLEERLPTCRGANRVAVNGSTGIAIKLETLDKKFHEMPFMRVDLIKIDVEGYELKVLRGAKDVLAQFKPNLFIEVDEDNLRDQGDSASALVLFLQEAGYTHITRVDKPEPLSHLTNFTGCHFDLKAQVK